MSRRSRRYFLGFIVLVSTLIGLSVGALSTQAQENFEVGETSVVVPANGQATINFEAFCIEVGKDFPTTLGDPNPERAPEAVRKVVKAAIEGGQIENDKLQTQIAIWQQINGEWPYDESIVDRTVAQSLIDTADTLTLSAIQPEGVPLDEAVADGTVTISSEDFQAADAPDAQAGDPPYYGRGTLTVVNNTAEDVTVYFPFGLVFDAPTDTEQDVVAFATDLQQAATPTPEVTETPTVEATETPAADTAVTTTPEETTTTTPQADAAVVVQEATPTPTPSTPGTLPQTGAADDFNTSALLLLMIVGVFSVLAGLMIRHHNEVS